MSLKRVRNEDEFLVSSNKVIVREGVNGSKVVGAVAADAVEQTAKNDKGQVQWLNALLATQDISFINRIVEWLAGVEKERGPRKPEVWRPQEFRISSSRAHLEVVVMRVDNEGYVSWRGMHIPDEIWVKILKLVPIDQVCQILQHCKVRFVPTNIVPTRLVMLLSDAEVLEASAKLSYGPRWMPPAMKWTRPSITGMNVSEHCIDYYMLLNCNGCENCGSKRVFKKTVSLQTRLCDKCFSKFTVKRDRAAAILSVAGCPNVLVSTILRSAKRCNSFRETSTIYEMFYSVKDLKRLSAGWKEHFGPGKTTNLTQEQWIGARDTESRLFMSQVQGVESWLRRWTQEKQQRKEKALKIKAGDIWARTELYHRRELHLALRLLDLDKICTAFEDPEPFNALSWAEVEYQIDTKWPELQNMKEFTIRSQRHANLLRLGLEGLYQENVPKALENPELLWLWKGCYSDDYNAVKLLREYGFSTVKATEGWATAHEIYDELILYFGTSADRRLPNLNRDTRLDVLRSLLARVMTQVNVNSPKDLGMSLHAHINSGKLHDLSWKCFMKLLA